MEMTVEFNNVYGGREHPVTETITVEAPSKADEEDDFLNWADENLHPHTGDGHAAADKHAGYFATIVECAERPDLVDREFTWGV
ncbi:MULTISPECIES: hypothetical protein [Mycolicibacterium]|uniref:hypothetical protein n=1 Tax=Mycolicibacterium TaxID=1866885 RepID=UPI001CDB5CB8|nr:hypothetical protein [Mycolicibacterium fortuitum]UBV20309.1 hypothetical protein H8Z59_24000 [Mycolicibacterium fortuitum]